MDEDIVQFIKTLDAASKQWEGKNSGKKADQPRGKSTDQPRGREPPTKIIVGEEVILSTLGDIIARTNSTCIITLPNPISETLEALSEMAYKKKATRFMISLYLTDKDAKKYGDIITKMKSFGNIQFRRLKQPFDYMMCTRDAEEVLIAPLEQQDGQRYGLWSRADAFSFLYAQFIGPVLLANSVII